MVPVSGLLLKPLAPGRTADSSASYSGPEYRALKPQDGAVTDLPAGGSIEIEIACQCVPCPRLIAVLPCTLRADQDRSRRAQRRMDVVRHPPDRPGFGALRLPRQLRCARPRLHRFPGDELTTRCTLPGAYHAGDPAGPLDDSLVSGCALAIADKDDIEKVGWDDLAVFSVNHNCVRQKVTTFEVRDTRRDFREEKRPVNSPPSALSQVPERMPSCTGDKCVCAWCVRVCCRA